MNTPFIDEGDIRRTLAIAREVAFPDAAPSVLPTFDPSGLFDRTPAQGAVVGPAERE